MKGLSKSILNFSVSAFAIVFFSVSSAFALSPTISLEYANGNDYTLKVYGDANQAVILFYHSNSNPGTYTNTTIGTTNPSGNLTYTFSLSQLNIVPNDSVYVSVNGNTSNILSLNTIQTSVQGYDESSYYNYFQGGNQNLQPANTNMTAFFPGTQYFVTPGLNSNCKNQTHNVQKIVKRKIIKKLPQKHSHDRNFRNLR